MKWISVEDELPKDFQEVLYFAVTNDTNSREIMTGHRENGHWKHCCMFYSSQTLNDLVRVTHWMELPDYPKPKMDLDEKTKDFAKRFIDENIDLLTRLANR